MIIEYEIPNWEMYNPRNDRRKHSWFRLQNTVFDDYKFFGLCSDSKVVYLYLLTLSSKNNSARVCTHVRKASSDCGLTEKIFYNCFNELIKESLVTPVGNQLVTTPTPIGCPTDGRTDEQCDEPSVVTGGGGVDAVEQFVEWWNTGRECFPEVRELTPGRRKKVAAQIKKFSSLDYWEQYRSRALQSKFCRGEVTPKDGRKPWKFNFDWMLSEDKRVKVLEGVYDDKSEPKELVCYL